MSNVVITARGAEALEATAAELRRAARGEVRSVAGDITTPAGREAALAACPQVDILVNNAGGPPPGDFRDWDRAAWIEALDANMLTPIELIRATVDDMAARGYGRVVNITSGAVKAPIDVLGLSNGARSGLTGFVAGLARSNIAARGVTINSLLPGAFDTDRLRAHDAGRREEVGQDIEAVAEARRKRHPGASLRHRRGVRCGVRVPLQRSGGLHDRPEHPARRWRLPGNVLNRAVTVGIGAPQFQHCSNGPSISSWQLRQAQRRDGGLRSSSSSAASAPAHCSASCTHSSGSVWSGGTSPAMLLA